MTKRERFISCMIESQMLGETTHWHGSRGNDGHRGRMSNMNSVLHQSLSINEKGGYFLLTGLVVIDVNP
jgi:hypothetical protein